MANAHTPYQPRNSMRIEDVADHAISFTLEKSAFEAAGYDATRILASVL